MRKSKIFPLISETYTITFETSSKKVCFQSKESVPDPKEREDACRELIFFILLPRALPWAVESRAFSPDTCF